MPITRQDVLMGRDKEYPLDATLEANLEQLLIAINKFEAIYGKPLEVSSGYRPGHYNVTAHGAPHSNHTLCLACDFHDRDGSIDQWITLDREQSLEASGLWREGQAYTQRWVHLQCVPFNSYVPGKTRSFKP